ncbi:protein WUSCHEL [Prunus yedoensis var. nudiflora]|uniref:Protein WUSCHEL n=1 Tax=Prunus yedoensis var. nudiflora TaxID=2094558 RepID=A0A314ZC77_PRUYE|nr:protein WUSCHEL [Prunus yedoensis var. nudiflora]
MEPQQTQQQPNEDGSNKGTSGTNFLCRQSSTRWTPTSDQIRILKDLYYNNGVRSPSAEQIQRISARLRQYGKIEGKTFSIGFRTTRLVRGRRKGLGINNNAPTAYEPINHSNKYPNISASAGVSSASASSAGVIAVGQMGSYGYGSMTMEKSFRDCSISAAGGTSSGHVGGSNNNIGHNVGSWVGVDPYSSPYTLFDKRSSSRQVFGDQENMMDEEDLEYQENLQDSPEIETLPLFPMHGEDIHGFGNIKSTSDGYYSGWYRSDDGNNGRTSLELSLNSYGHMTPDYFRSY